MKDKLKNMNLKHIVGVVLILLIVIFLSGCIAGPVKKETPVGESNVKFAEFYPVAPEVYEGGTITLYLSVQNNGYFDAKNVQVMLYNCGDIEANKITVAGDEANYECNDYFDFADLRKPDRELGVAGETEEAEITLDVPDDLPAGRSQHTFTARVKYGYMSTATRDMVLTSFENWKERGGTLETGALNIYSEPAPVSLSINTPTTLIITDPENNQQKFSVSVSLRNIGKGYVPDKTLEEVKLCYDSKFVEFKGSVDFEFSSKGCIKAKSETLKLIGIKNQWRDLSAEFETKKINGLIQDVASFDATATYNYSLDQSTSVTLIGRGK